MKRNILFIDPTGAEGCSTWHLVQTDAEPEAVAEYVETLEDGAGNIELLSNHKILASSDTATSETIAEMQIDEIKYYIEP